MAPAHVWSQNRRLSTAKPHAAMVARTGIQPNRCANRRTSFSSGFNATTNGSTAINPCGLTPTDIAASTRPTPAGNMRRVATARSTAANDSSENIATRFSGRSPLS